MKKSMRANIAKRIVEGIRKGTITVDRDGVIRRRKPITGEEGPALKRKLSKYIILRMGREGARLNAAGFWYVPEGQ